MIYREGGRGEGRRGEERRREEKKAAARRDRCEREENTESLGRGKRRKKTTGK